MMKGSMLGLLGLTIAYFFSQFFRAFLPVLTPALTKHVGTTQEDLSTAAALWFIVFGLMQFPVGIMLDRIGPRRTVATLFGLAASSGALLFGIATEPWMIIVAMGLIGAGCAPVLMGTLFIFARTMQANQLAILTSWFVALGSLGNLASATPLATITSAYGWRPAMLCVAASTVVVAFAIFFMVRDPARETSENTGLAGYVELLKIKALWPILLMGLVLYAPVANLRGLWAGPFLSDVFQADALVIGRVTLWMGIAIIVGSLIYGPLDKILNTRKWIIFTGNLITLAAVSMLAINPASTINQVTISLIVIGVCGTSYGVLMAHGKAFIPTSLTGRGVTLLNFTTIFGAGAAQYITGALAATHNDPSSVSTYQSVFWAYAAMSGFALAVYLFAKDAKPHSQAHR